MTLAALLYVIAIILFVLSSVPIESRVNLFYLAWAFTVAAFAFGGTVVLR